MTSSASASDDNDPIDAHAVVESQITLESSSASPQMDKLELNSDDNQDYDNTTGNDGGDNAGSVSQNTNDLSEQEGHDGKSSKEEFDTGQQQDKLLENEQDTQLSDNDNSNEQIDDQDINESNDNNEDDDDDDDDDFGDFDDFDDFESAEPPASTAPDDSTNTINNINISSIPTLSEHDFTNSAQLQATISELLTPLKATSTFLSPSLSSSSSSSSSDPTGSNTLYFNSRSASLWQQLALVPPQATATDWKRSSIRRLFMVSLGVPLDLDEILPQKNSKRLVLPSRDLAVSPTRVRSRTQGADGVPTGPDSAETLDLESETDQNVVSWRVLAQVSSLALQNMSVEELQVHIQALNNARRLADRTLELWEARRDAALKDKADFETLIESLVDYAQRVGKPGKAGKPAGGKKKK